MDEIKKVLLFGVGAVASTYDKAAEVVEELVNKGKITVEEDVYKRQVLIYATSNRKNLIREGFNDRQGDEIHARETVEEKHSLAERRCV